MLLAHWRALAPADVMFRSSIGPQSTSSIAARSIPADSNADYSTAAGTRVSAARTCRPTHVNVADVTHDVLLCFVAFATGMPLRATGDYFLGGFE